MRALSGASLLLASTLAACSAADGPRGLPKPPAIPDVMPPAPVTATGARVKLSGDALYVADFAEDCVLRAHPAGLVKATREVGPIRIRAKFADGSGLTETRVYHGKVVYILEAIGTGAVEIDVIPLGAALKSEADIKTATVDVDIGHAPQPPPKPSDPPAPKPDPGPKAAKIAVVVVEETRDRTPQQGKVIFDKGVRDWLKAGGHTIDVLDRNDPAAAKNGLLPYAERVGLPAVIVFDGEATGPQVPLKQFRLPETAITLRAELELAVKR